MSERVHTTCWIPKAVHDALKLVALEEERSMTWMIERAIKDALIRKGRISAHAKFQGEAA
jgi:hypothetical protein